MAIPRSEEYPQFSEASVRWFREQGRSETWIAKHAFNKAVWRMHKEATKESHRAVEAAMAKVLEVKGH